MSTSPSRSRYRYQQRDRTSERKSIRYLNGHYHGATLGALGVTGIGARAGDRIGGAERWNSRAGRGR